MKIEKVLIKPEYTTKIELNTKEVETLIKMLDFCGKSKEFKNFTESTDDQFCKIFEMRDSLKVNPETEQKLPQKK